MIQIGRMDSSIVGRWWWTVDRWLLGAVGLLLMIGMILILAAGPAAAQRVGLDPYHFVNRQLVFLVPAILVMFVVSLFEPKTVRRAATLGFLAGWFLMILAIFFGPEIKGAHRWLQFAGLSIQPSEFVKPCFAVLCAWMLAEHHRSENFPGYRIAIVIYLLTAGVLMKQPDFGMTIVVSAVFGAQLFLSGVPLLVIGLLGALGLAGAFMAYSFFPHIQARIDKFLNPEASDTFQIDRATEALSNGGAWGAGPGEGTVKYQIPDAHTDFIFAVAAEEFGVVLCLIIILLFGFIVWRGFDRVRQDGDYFVMLATGGLLVQFGLQAIINIGVNLHLMPTKGMTLPFISYGGSSLLALAGGMGMVLALTRQRVRSSIGATP